MTNEANIFYKPLRRVSFCDENQTKKNAKTFPETFNMPVVTMTCEEPAKLSKSPRLMVRVLLKFSFDKSMTNLILCWNSFISLKRWIAAESKHPTKKLTRQSTVGSFRINSAKEHEANESADFGVCLLKDSPYRILRVSQ